LSRFFVLFVVPPMFWHTWWNGCVQVGVNRPETRWSHDGNQWHILPLCTSEVLSQKSLPVMRVRPVASSLSSAWQSTEYDRQETSTLILSDIWTRQSRSYRPKFGENCSKESMRRVNAVDDLKQRLIDDWDVLRQRVIHDSVDAANVFTRVLAKKDIFGI